MTHSTLELSFPQMNSFIIERAVGTRLFVTSALLYRRSRDIFALVPVYVGYVIWPFPHFFDV